MHPKGCIYFFVFHIYFSFLNSVGDIFMCFLKNLQNEAWSEKFSLSAICTNVSS